VNPREIYSRLGAVVEAIARREDATQPTQAAYNNARRILANSGHKGSISARCCPATVYRVTDDAGSHTVNVYDSNGTVLDAECFCGSAAVCEHLLAVLADHDGKIS
jgi:hypothetical protein